MPETIARRPDFGAMLESEVEIILEDPAFERSPVQSKLLQYLCEQTISGETKVTQFGIAVDGLGRSDDYDLSSESYPRVQISRLRQNLAEYYSRIKPSSGLCVFVRRGDYKLRLAPYEKAYPPGSARDRASAEPEPDTATPAEPDAPARPAAVSRKALVAGLALALALVTIAALRFLQTGPEASAAELSGPPSIALAVTDSVGAASSQDPQLRAELERTARAQIASSFIARLASADDIDGEPAYRISVDLGVHSAGGTEASVALTDREEQLLYSDNVSYAGDRSDFLRRVEAVFTHVLTPSGVVAQDLVRGMESPDQSDFACHLHIEARRADGMAPMQLLERCLERFPDSDYLPYWQARQAFLLYQERIARGEVIDRSGEAWELVRSALLQDRYNAYANTVMARLEFAQGRCGTAEQFGARALVRGSYYPALYAMYIAEQAGCEIPEERADDIRRDLIALSENNPSPDPLLRLYLILASEAVGLRNSVRFTCGTAALEEQEGAVGDTARLVCRSVADPTYFRANRRAVMEGVGLFVWSGAARDNLERQLEGG